MSLKFKLALSTNGKTIDEALFQSYAENGIEAMEISCTTAAAYDKLDFSQLQEWSEKYDVKLWSFHLPFWPFDKIDISNPDICAETIDTLEKYVIKANDIGIKLFIIHQSGEPIEESAREEKMLCAQKSLKELAEFARKLGCTIAIEDLPRSCLGNCSCEILKLLSAHDNLRVCFDTNHLLDEDIIDFIHNVGSKIITLHISDYDYINERHWLPGEGKIDWQAVISALEEVGYEGYWLYEIEFSAPWSIDRNRDLTCADFKNNFISLMQKKPRKN